MTSMFGRPQALAGGGINNERLEAATVELEMVSDMFNRLVRSCHAKCIDRHYLEETLNKGEGVCADRCVAKWFVTNELIGERMQATSATMQGQAGQAPAQQEKKGWFS